VQTIGGELTAASDTAGGVDPIFSDQRLADLYDVFDPDRSDLTTYVDMAVEVGASSLVDVGCGTGTFACLAAALGLTVHAVDPAAASLEVGRRKPGASTVRWHLGAAEDLEPLGVDLATMTGNVAQVFLSDASWLAALEGVRRAVRPGGSFAFESRDPSREAWLEWTKDRTLQRAAVPGTGIVSTWVDVLAVEPPIVTFRHTFAFKESGEVLTSDSSIRFRTREELDASLGDAGWAVIDVRDAADRPGHELVYLVQRSETAGQCLLAARRARGGAGKDAGVATSRDLIAISEDAASAVTGRRAADMCCSAVS
jgi:SAM-dependent methyltransferase